MIIKLQFPVDGLEGKITELRSRGYLSVGDILEAQRAGESPLEIDMRAIASLFGLDHTEIASLAYPDYQRAHAHLLECMAPPEDLAKPDPKG